jgi:REP element-mobilizing transposase RayT
MARRQRVQEGGATYHVTTHGMAELAVLPDAAAKQHFLWLLAEVGGRERWRIRAYCLMTTHYHLLVTTPEPTISTGMRSLNGRYARWLNFERERRGHVWEERFHGNPIRQESHFLECIRYLALNPVRAGIVTTPQEWTWSSYAALAGLSRPADFLDQTVLYPLFGPTRAVSISQIREFVETAARPDSRPLALAA